MLPKGLLKEYSRALAMMMKLMDMFIIFIAGVIAYQYRFNQINLSGAYLTAVLIAIFFTPIIFSCFNIYSSVRGKGLISHFIHLIQAILIMILCLAGLAFFTKSGAMYSRLWLSAWMLLAIFLLISFRCCILFFLRFMRTKGLNERRVVIFGAGELGTKLAETVQQALWTGFRIVSFLDDHREGKFEAFNRIPIKQTPENLDEWLTDQAIDEIWIALPLGAQSRVKDILYQLRHHTITTRFVLNIFGLDLFSHSITEVAGFPVLNIRSTPMKGINRLIKAIEDRLLGLMIIIAITPLLALIASLVKLTSKGPIFFKQQRLGWDGRVIKVYKFRTMYVHAEKGNTITQATLKDARITPLGKFLRRTSLDELPQFINVLQGRMSIVGPRPHALFHNELYKETVHTYMQRHRVKPGITGWAQVNGWRGETDTLAKMQKRVEYDLYYINNWSLAFDFKIILLTLLRGFYSRNAY